MEEKQNTNVMAADLDNVLQRNFLLLNGLRNQGNKTNTTEKTKTHQQARKKFVVKFNLKNISIYLVRYMSFC